MIQKEKGFTLIEILMSLTVFFIILSLLTTAFHLSWSYTTKRGNFHYFEWVVFIQQAKIELRESKDVHIYGTTIQFDKWTGERVTYEKYETIIRRRVNATGHEMMLQFIQHISYEKEQTGIRIRVLTDKGDAYEAFIPSFRPYEK
ncbi:competence protein comGF [Anoxybacillus ayderensis]|uniref:competence type IV pilus minor pilin ComGF n=1 Tax=Anoxybacillus TaxID=150247 RepID=UPI0002BEC06E|nr:MULTISPECIES: competence type IV pilus minor pilin ComGF [Anoxybacillus]AXM89836.1 prepilin-type N-terminal cleavage/methylation domain-containing protein [Anoxybacillus ayderensis G10]EMI09851.1 competence protein comGF [Anoxybacillus gonensis]MBW9217955.1 prepilin-type N-terminal cleavage/methylation domain-containing protein [Anoxybacillus sp. ST70]THD17159.1 competence protein comGF [Anoxybacillus ayderensis]